MRDARTAIIIALAMLPLTAHADVPCTPYPACHRPTVLTVPPSGTRPLSAWEEMALQPVVRVLPTVAAAPTNVPEPGSLALLGAGIAGLWMVRRKLRT